MKFECNEGGAFTVILVGLGACFAAGFIVFQASETQVKVECHRAQVAAFAASVPASAPSCPTK